MFSLSRGLVTDSSPEMGFMMKILVGGWSAPGPVTLYLRERLLSLSDLICRGVGEEHIVRRRSSGENPLW